MTTPSGANLEILANPEALARRVADWMLGMATAKDGAFAVALSGGSTPRRLYERLAQRPYCDAFPWSRTHWFWADERFVPHDDLRSNYRMVREAMLAHVPIPNVNVHPIPTMDVTPEACALAYESELKSYYGAKRLDSTRPLFDVTLLGLGQDGHTASLFPGSAVLTERERWVAAVLGVTSEVRLTLTYPTLESSGHVAFLVSGIEKREIFGRLRRGNGELPAARLHPIAELTWFIDMAAVGNEI